MNGEAVRLVELLAREEQPVTAGEEAAARSVIRHDQSRCRVWS